MHLILGSSLNLINSTYNIGLANFLQPNYPNAKEFFSKALKVIELRITHLEARIAELESTSKGKEKATDDNPSVLDRKELEELRELYPEIKAKVGAICFLKKLLCSA